MISMTSRYETFNEMTFEAYCKKAVENAIKKERNKKTARGKLELSLSALTDAALCTLPIEDDRNSTPEEPCQIFHIREMLFPIYDPKLSQALSYLLPKDREIILLHFFKGLTDAKVAALIHTSQATVFRRRKAAMKRLRELVENYA